MDNRNYLFTSESVTEGHPDKMADQISDAILDAMLKDDPFSRVACETMLTTGLVIVSGEVTTKTYVDIPAVVRNTVAISLIFVSTSGGKYFKLYKASKSCSKRICSSKSFLNSIFSLLIRSYSSNLSSVIFAAPII